MSRLDRIALTSLLAAALFIAIAGYVLLSHPSIEPDASLEWQPAAGRLPPGRLTARFFGVGTVLLDDGETAIMTDGFFSRPGKLRLVAARIAPDEERIARGLQRGGVGRLAAVLVAHSHHDHAMDAASVARRTGALVIGSESTANIARGGGFPGERIRVIAGGESFSFGRFRITAFKSPHSPGALFEGEIQAPLKTPARASAYREGGNFSYLAEHDGRRVLVHASTNFRPGLYRDVRADVVFLGVAVLGKQSAEFAEDYWREVVKATGARLVIPIHWDDFTLPLEAPLKPMSLLMNRFERGMESVRRMAARDGVAVRMMPLFAPVDLLAAVAE
jgi:L-ascorbate metabolism protein UlaG (beta-lactamase superfamily)